MKKEQIELLELDASGIHAAEYLTDLSLRELLQGKLKNAVEVDRTTTSTDREASEHIRRDTNCRCRILEARSYFPV